MIRVAEEPPATTPAAGEIPGPYSRTGTLLDNTCGDDPPRELPPPVQLIVVESRVEDGRTILRMVVGNQAFEGEYDQDTGEWEGATGVHDEGGRPTRRRHEGVWRRQDDGQIFYRGLLFIESLDAAGDVVCGTVYDVEYRRR